MQVGVTGTREGFTGKQQVAFVEALRICRPTFFHHGSCTGVDVQAARLADGWKPRPCIVCHPGPADDPWQEKSGVDDETQPGKNHFARNRDIVDACEVLLVCPKDMGHQPRGGTWYTHDYAKKKGKQIFICWPDGTLLLANGPAAAN